MRKARVSELTARRPADHGAQRGKVACGNVGSPMRLDCTVIGPPVNKLSRLEFMCDPIERRLLLSEACAAAILEDGPVLPSLGCHGFRSVRKPVNLFTVENLPGA